MSEQGLAPTQEREDTGYEGEGDSDRGYDDSDRRNDGEGLDGIEPEDFGDHASTPEDLEDGTNAGTGSTNKPRAAISRQNAGRVIAKFVELTEAPALQVTILAAALGVKDDAADVAATIMSSIRVPLGGIGDVIALADASDENPYAAMMKTMTWDRDQVKAAWSLLNAAGILTGALPGKESAAQVALAQAAEKIGADERRTFDAVRALGRK